jgi:hypothetical protein
VVDCLDKIFDYHFFRVNCPEKRGFSNSRSKFHHLYHHTSYLSWGYFFTAYHDFWILISKLERFGFKARGLGICGIDYLFFSKLFEK